MTGLGVAAMSLYKEERNFPLSSLSLAQWWSRERENGSTALPLYNTLYVGGFLVAQHAIPIGKMDEVNWKKKRRYWDAVMSASERENVGRERVKRTSAEGAE